MQNVAHSESDLALIEKNVNASSETFLMPAGLFDDLDDSTDANSRSPTTGTDKMLRQPVFKSATPEKAKPSSSKYTSTPILKRPFPMAVLTETFNMTPRRDTKTSDDAKDVLADTSVKLSPIGAQRKRPHSALLSSPTSSRTVSSNDLMNSSTDSVFKRPRFEPAVRAKDIKEIPAEARSTIRRIASDSIAASFTDATIPSEVYAMSKYLLKTVGNPQQHHTAYASIDGETLRVLISKMDDETFQKHFVLVDCRYSYEYEGGHVKNAINISDPEALEEFFFPRDPARFEQVAGKTPIFYCEFSQKRGPTMAANLRKCDRRFNDYPFIHYEEIYILEKGYREFFSDDENKDLCTPRGYVEMHDPRFSTILSKKTQHTKRPSRRPKARYHRGAESSESAGQKESGRSPSRASARCRRLFGIHPSEEEQVWSSQHYDHHDHLGIPYLSNTRIL